MMPAASTETSMVDDSNNGREVRSQEALTSWTDTVLQDGDLTAKERLLLLALPQQIDERSWTVELYPKEVIDRFACDQTGFSESNLYRVLKSAIESEYVRQVDEHIVQGEDGKTLDRPILVLVLPD